MANVLRDLGAGLRAAGGVLNPKIQQQAAQAEENQVARQFAANEARDTFSRNQSNLKIKLQLESNLANKKQLAEAAQSLNQQSPDFQQRFSQLQSQADALDQQNQQILQGLATDPNMGTPQGMDQQGQLTGQPESISLPGPKPQFQPEVLQIPGLPEGSTAVRTGPNSVRILDPDSGQETNFKTIETEDGRLAITSQTGDNPPEFAGFVQGDGGPIRTGVSARADRRTTAAEKRSQQIQNRFDRSFKQRASKQNTTVENQARDDFRADFKGIRDVERGLNTLDSLLATDDLTALDSKAIQNTLSNILNTSVRAQAELESFKTFGNLGQRISQLANRFVSGTFTEASLDQVRSLSARMRQQVVNPSKNELQTFYRGVVERQGGNPDNVTLQPDQPTDRPVSEMSIEELQAEIARGR